MWKNRNQMTENKKKLWEMTQKKVNFRSEVPTYYRNVFNLHLC